VANFVKTMIFEQNCYYHREAPAVTVIVDGEWSKLTHRHSYNALSGVGSIIGKYH